MKRVYQSGSQKLKKRKKDEEDIAKYPKLTSFFQFPSSDSVISVSVEKHVEKSIYLHN